MSFSPPITPEEAAAIDEMIADGKWGLNEIAKIAGRGYELVRKRAIDVRDQQHKQRQSKPAQQQLCKEDTMIRAPTKAELMAGRSSYGNPRL